MGKNLQTVLDKKMDRREFFGLIGAAILALIGVTGMLESLLRASEGNHKHGPVQGYGSAGYGKS